MTPVGRSLSSFIISRPPSASARSPGDPRPNVPQCTRLAHEGPLCFTPWEGNHFTTMKYCQPLSLLSCSCRRCCGCRRRARALVARPDPNEQESDGLLGAAACQCPLEFALARTQLVIGGVRRSARRQPWRGEGQCHTFRPSRPRRRLVRSKSCTTGNWLARDTCRTTPARSVADPRCWRAGRR